MRVSDAFVHPIGPDGRGFAGRLIDEMRSGVDMETQPSELDNKQITRLHQLLHEAKFKDPDGSHLSPAGLHHHLPAQSITIAWSLDHCQTLSEAEVMPETPQVFHCPGCCLLHKLQPAANLWRRGTAAVVSCTMHASNMQCYACVRMCNAMHLAVICHISTGITLPLERQSSPAHSALLPT